MIKIIDDEVLLPARLRFPPRADDTCIELENQVAIVAHSLTSGVKSFAHSEASAECTGIGHSKQRRAVHDRWRELATRNWFACILRYLDGIC